MCADSSSPMCPVTNCTDQLSSMCTTPRDKWPIQSQSLKKSSRRRESCCNTLKSRCHSRLDGNVTHAQKLSRQQNKNRLTIRYLITLNSRFPKTLCQVKAGLIHLQNKNTNNTVLLTFTVRRRGKSGEKGIKRNYFFFLGKIICCCQKSL